MAKLTKKRPTPAQRRVLMNLVAGRPADFHCRSMSDHGGLHGTLASLHRNGWLADGKITDTGRAAVAPSAV